MYRNVTADFAQRVDAIGPITVTERDAKRRHLAFGAGFDPDLMLVSERRFG